MKQFLVLFREPDGRKEQHPEAQVQQHRRDWQQWMEKLMTDKKLSGGRPLTLKGNVIKGKDKHVISGPHKHGEEIVGGYLIINAASLEETTNMIKGCPVFDVDGYAEVREMM